MPIAFEDAVIFAAHAHRGQVYRGYNHMPDTPYILHPMRVANKVWDKETRIVAVLHDCLEDYGRIPNNLGPDVYEALLLLTKGEDESYEEYIKRICEAEGKAGALAREVKMADLEDNMYHDPPYNLLSRYIKAVQTLENAMI